MDQYECDVERTPMFLCDNWKNLDVPYQFEVYELLEDKTFKLVKEYDTPLETGMALVYWDDSNGQETKKVINKWPNKESYHKIPKEVKKIFGKITKEQKSDLESVESCFFEIDRFHYYTYGWYADNRYGMPW